MELILNGETITNKQIEKFNAKISVNFLDNYDFTVDDVYINIPIEYYARIEKIQVNRVEIKDGADIIFFGYPYKPSLDYKNKTLKMACAAAITDFSKIEIIGDNPTAVNVDSLLLTLVSDSLVPPYNCSKFFSVNKIVDCSFIFNTGDSTEPLTSAVKAILEATGCGLLVDGTTLKIVPIPVIWPRSARNIDSVLLDGMPTNITLLAEYFYDAITLTYSTNIGVSETSISVGTGSQVLNYTISAPLFCNAASALNIANRLLAIHNRNYWITNFSTNINTKLNIGEFVQVADFIFMIKSRTISGFKIDYEVIGIKI